MIGVFDSGLGGLSILKAIRKQLPQYDYLYFGDNARAPYGTRSPELVYRYTWQCVHYLFEKGCHLVILACNTASAKALRDIQQNELLQYDPKRRVLGVIRPTIEQLPQISHTGHIGILATEGTVRSNAFPIEIHKLAPELKITQQACPMWVPLVENNEHNGKGADFFVKKYLQEILVSDPDIDTLVLGCTHYPFLYDKIKNEIQNRQKNITVIKQGEMVALSLQDYLHRHPEIETTCTKNATCTYFTTETAKSFNEKAKTFMNEQIYAENVEFWHDL